uniref:Uncharacterized protein n=1 Tax=viral metagenome TaxID=1070528 RepID=A0A6M3KXM2_9ZZZZ
MSEIRAKIQAIYKVKRFFQESRKRTWGKGEVILALVEMQRNMLIEEVELLNHNTPEAIEQIIQEGA